MKEQIYNVTYFLALIAYFVPLLIVVLKKMWNDKIILLFAIYWTAGGIINVSDQIPGISAEASALMAVIYNLIDFPLVLFIFYYSTSSIRLKKFIKMVGPAYVLIEIINCIVKGVKYDDLIYVMGLGTLLVLIVASWEVIRYMRKMEHASREKAMIFIYAAMLFEYGTYVIIYIFDFFLVPEEGSYDNLLIYYISTLVAVGIASVGFLSRDLRVREETFRLKFRA